MTKSWSQIKTEEQMFSRMILWIVYLDVMKRTQTSDTTNCGLGFTLRLRLDGDALG